ncbi:hypothetical protein RDWZM_010296 [Blomia tropicalis]|uniref:Uncharacterized protein n=1 Tax=Blomia tropicalis TaxID=40697 RepID=A0A9Q0RIL8_BLOTA|nr:hypothetical protein RDWZM_010296 [Blomia tropicalis]
MEKYQFYSLIIIATLFCNNVSIKLVNSSKYSEDNDDNEDHRYRRMLYPQSSIMIEHGNVASKMIQNYSDGHYPTDTPTTQQSSETIQTVHAIIELNMKLESMFKLMESAFGRIGHRLESIETKMSRYEQVLVHFEEKLNRIKPNGDRIQKLFNINTEVYRICKESLIHNQNFGQTMEQDESTIGTNRLANAFAAAFKPLIPPNTGSDASSSSSSSSSLKRNNEPPPFDTEQIIVENGSTATTRSQNRITSSSSIYHQRTMKHRQTNDNVTNAIDMEAEQRAMLTVIETIANYTLEKFSNQIERKMAEEFNVYGFQVRERFDQTEEYFGKVARISKHLLDANEQITTNIFELKDQIREEQTLMESVEMRLNKMLQIKNEQQQQQQKMYPILVIMKK